MWCFCTSGSSQNSLVPLIPAWTSIGLEWPLVEQVIITGIISYYEGIHYSINTLIYAIIIHMNPMLSEYKCNLDPITFRRCTYYLLLHSGTREYALISLTFSWPLNVDLQISFNSNTFCSFSAITHYHILCILLVERSRAISLYWSNDRLTLLLV